MKEAVFSSPAIAKQMQKKYGSSAKVVKINIKHADAVRTYVKKIDEAHKKAAGSKLFFH